MLGILPLQSQYIYSLMSFVSTNRELFVNNADIHNFPTRSHKDLHLPIAHLSVFQKGVYFSGIKIYNNLPTGIKQISHDTIKFKKAVKRFLLDKFFTHWMSIINGKKMLLVDR